MTAPARIPGERSFGLSVGPASIAFGALLAWRGHPRAGGVAAAIGLALVFGALVAPTALRVPNRLWWRFATVLGWINSRILLTVFFLAVLTPVGWVMRLAGRNPLRSTGTGSNWTGYNDRRREPRHYEHLY
jgi:hypothetical protein